MSQPLSVQVVPGYQFPTDGSVQLTYALLNLLGKPTVNLYGALNALTIADGAITTSKLVDGAVTLAKLATNVLQTGGLRTVGETVWFRKAPTGAVLNPNTGRETSVLPQNGASWVLCDGSLANQDDYPRLYSWAGNDFAADSTKDGVVNTAAHGTFRVPNLLGMFPFGSDGSNAPGTIAGEKTHLLTTAELPAHSHTQSQYYYNQVAGGGSNLYGLTRNDSPVKTALTNAVQATDNSTGGGGAHNNMPPYNTGYFYVFAGFLVGGVWI